MVTTKLTTVEDVERLPDDDFRYALLWGVLYRMPPPKFVHGRVTNTIGRHVGNFVDEHGLGVVSAEAGFVLARDPDVLLEPDVAFVRADRVPIDQEVYPELAPDLVVEVVSPSNTGPAIADKVRAYLEAGVRLVWVFSPRRRSVAVHRPDQPVRELSEADDLNGEDVLPGFRVRVGSLFD